MVSYLQDYDGDCASNPLCNFNPSHDRKSDQEYESAGSDYLDDVAQALFEIDLRPDLPSSTAFDSKNNIKTYLISFADDQAINDPLMLRAATQGGGQKFIAGNEAQLNQAFAAALSSIVQSSASASSASVNSGSISSETRIYQAKFSSATWTGELFSYGVNPDGSLRTTADTDPDTADPWEASNVLPAFGSRKIITVNSDGTPVAFRWTAVGGNTFLDDTRKDSLSNNSAYVDYLRGSNANEGPLPANFRVRQDQGGQNKLGDIVASAPLFVGRPPFRYRDSLESEPYSEFATDNADRRQMVYVGANDGMLHGFDANTGVEVFAFIPSPMFDARSASDTRARLTKLADKTYTHEFFVDGSPSMGDVFFSDDWHTVLVGGLNKGGKGIYALDITNPGTLANAEGAPGSIVLWEFTPEDDPDGVGDLGLTYSQPAIVKLQNGTWAAVFGNGYNSTNGHAILYIVDISDGSLIAKMDTGALTAPTGVTWDNGLSTPALVDVNGDRKVDAAYAGDLFGNMWKFDLTGTDPDGWGVAFGGSPLFQARDAATGGNAQPITVRPEVARGPRGRGTIVLFGTGKYLEPADKQLTPQQTQSFYGIIDTGSTVGGRDSLRSQQITQQFRVNPGNNAPPVNVRITTQNALGANAGWYLDLLNPAGANPGPAGYVAEKQVTNPIVRDGKVVFTTLIPNTDPCGSGGTSWLMELDMLSGARLGQAPFDINRDGQFDEEDMVTQEGEGDEDDEQVDISGIQSAEEGAGILQAPGVIEGETGGGVCVQFKYMPDSSGNIQRVNENCGPGGLGRQSWRQVR